MTKVSYGGPFRQQLYEDRRKKTSLENDKTIVDTSPSVYSPGEK